MFIKPLIWPIVLWLLSAPIAFGDVTVFAASSLRGVLDEIIHTGEDSVHLSYGGSGSIARQIDQGAPADLVVLAHPRWMTWLQSRNLSTIGDPVMIARNRLVLIGPENAMPIIDPKDIPARLEDARLAMGQRDSVPAGIYARQWLQSEGLWETLKPHLAEVENVRLALTLVARAEVPLGVVYHTDAQAEPKVKTLFHISPDHHQAIQYPALALTEKGAVLLQKLQQPQAQRIFQKHGFKLP